MFFLCVLSLTTDEREGSGAILLDIKLVWGVTALLFLDLLLGLIERSLKILGVSRHSDVV